MKQSAPTLDTRYLTVHPVTSQWWQQRDKCRQCVHYLAPEKPAVVRARGDYTAERCRVAVISVTTRTLYEACIDARGTAEQRGDTVDGVCGPDALLFQPKE